MQTGWWSAPPPRRCPFPRVRPLVGPRGAAETASWLLQAGEAPVRLGQGKGGSRPPLDTPSPGLSAFLAHLIL